MDFFERIIAWANANEGLLQGLAMLGGLLVVSASLLRRGPAPAVGTRSGVGALVSIRGCSPGRSRDLLALLEEHGGLVGSGDPEASFGDAADGAVAALALIDQLDGEERNRISVALSERRLERSPQVTGAVLVSPAIQRALAALPGIGLTPSHEPGLPYLLSRTASTGPGQSWLKPTLIGVGAVLILLGASLWYNGQVRSDGPGPVRSIAVLPLENLSGDPSQDYFSDGLTEALIGELARIHSLRVISRTSVMHYKRNPAPLPEIAKALDVQAVVEGSVIREGGRVRISAKLIRADTDQHLWAKDYDRELRDVLTLQREVARSVVDSIQSQLTPQETEQLNETYAVSPEALDLFLRALRRIDQRTLKSMDEGVRDLRRVIEIDPGFAEAHARLANAIFLRSLYSGASREIVQEVVETARRALVIDDRSALAHAILAYVGPTCAWDAEAAEKHSLRAFSINPNDPLIRRMRGSILASQGKFTEAAKEFRIAGSLDPLSRSFNVLIGISFYRLRRYDEALGYFNRVLEFDPEYPQALRWLGRTLSATGQPNRALELLDRAASRGKRAADDGWIGFVYHQLGRTKEARQALTRLEKSAAEGKVRRWQLARLYAALGERDAMVESLHKAYETCDIISMSTDLAFDPYLEDPGFAEALARFDTDIDVVRAIAAGKALDSL